MKNWKLNLENAENIFIALEAHEHEKISRAELLGESTTKGAEGMRLLKFIAAKLKAIFLLCCCSVLSRV